MALQERTNLNFDFGCILGIWQTCQEACEVAEEDEMKDELFNFVIQVLTFGDVGWGYSRHMGSQRAKSCSIFLHSASQSSEESPWVGNKTGHSQLSPAVTGCDQQDR